jgi:hypothetical protein
MLAQMKARRDTLKPRTLASLALIPLAFLLLIVGNEDGATTGVIALAVVEFGVPVRSPTEPSIHESPSTLPLAT